MKVDINDNCHDSQLIGEELPLSELRFKVLLTVEEANRLFGVGICKLRERMREPNCPFVIYVGDTKKLINRAKLEDYINKNRMF